MRTVPVPQPSSQDQLRKLFDSRIQQLVVAEKGHVSRHPDKHIALLTGTVTEYDGMITTVEDVHNLECPRNCAVDRNDLPKQREWILRSIKFARSFPILPDSPPFRAWSLEDLRLLYEIPDGVISSGEGYVHSLPPMVHAVPLRGDDPLYFTVAQPDSLGAPEDGDMLVVNYDRLNKGTEGLLCIVERPNWDLLYRVVEQ